MPSGISSRLNTVRSLLSPGLDEISAVHAVLRKEGRGTLVDVGAHFGTSLHPFADDGWQVVAIEPDPRNRAVLVHRMAGRPNVRIDPRAVTERDGDRVPLYTSTVSTGISTLHPFHASHAAGDSVETVRLDTLLADTFEVTVLKTDTEGFDLPALRTFPWTRLHPQAVVSEFEDRKTQPLGYDYHAMAGYMIDLGYAVLVSEWYPVVEYGQHHRWRSIRRYPTDLADPDGWGNLICVSPRYVGSVLSQATWRHRLRAKWGRAKRAMRR